jgi:hypothetical protein
VTILRLSDPPLNLTGVAPSCARCGQPVTIGVPADLMLRASDPASKRFTFRLNYRSRYGDPAMCVGGRLAAVPTDERLRLQAEYEELLVEAASEGMPAGMLWPLFARFDDDGPDMAWRGWRVRMLALQVLGLPPRLDGHPGLDAIWTERRDGAPLQLLIYQTALWNEALPSAGLVFHSGPHRSLPELEIRNRHRAERLSELEELMHGVTIYRAFRANLGRRCGTGRYARGEEAHFLEDVEQVLTRAEHDGIRFSNAQMLADRLAMGRTALFDMFRRTPEARHRFREDQRHCPIEAG